MFLSSVAVTFALLPFYGSLGGYGQPSAALWEDQLFVATTSRPGAGPSVLYRGKFAPAARRVLSPLEHDNPCGDIRQSTQAKLDLREDRLLLRSSFPEYGIYPLDQVWRMEDSAFGFGRFGGLEGYSEFLYGYGATYDRLLWLNHWNLNVLVSGDEWKHVRYDVLIAGKKSVWLFHAYKDKLLVSVEPDYLNNWYWDGDKMMPKENLPKPPERQLRTGKLPAEFTEAFTAYTADGHSYLVTPNGKVYVVAPKGKAELEVSAVWTDPKRKIVGVVQDLANDAVYGWEQMRRGQWNRPFPDTVLVDYFADGTCNIGLHYS
jgi:hypothetical protein